MRNIFCVYVVYESKGYRDRLSQAFSKNRLCQAFSKSAKHIL